MFPVVVVVVVVILQAQIVVFKAFWQVKPSSQLSNFGYWHIGLLMLYSELKVGTYI